MKEEVDRAELVRLRQVDRRLKLLFQSSEEWNLGLLALLDEPDALRRLVTEPELLPPGTGWEARKAFRCLREVRELVLGAQPLTAPEQSRGWISPLAVIGEPPEHRGIRFREANLPDDQVAQGFHPPEIHPTAIVEALATVDAGIAQPTRIGAHAYLMKHSHVGHDAQLGALVNLAPGAIVGGHCVIGDRVKIGLGASIRPRVTVGDDAVIGAGAVVVKDIPAGQKWAGNPAGPLEDYVPEEDRDLWEEWWSRSRAQEEQAWSEITPGIPAVRALPSPARASASHGGADAAGGSGGR